MARKIVWTEGQDARIRRMRAEGASWDIIAQQLGLARWTVIERAKLLGIGRAAAPVVAMDDLMRPPLPAGHPDSWDAITRDTSLAGLSFRPRAAVR